MEAGALKLCARKGERTTRTMSEFSDKFLGMDRPITRRDFVNGMAIGLGVLGAASKGGAQEQADYPPEQMGMRGSHPGSFETIHSLRDGTFWKNVGKTI